ncbi:MAG TPA: DUF4097 family beta strand repeat-containing protein [Acidimicrobiia bacterium]
MVWSFDTSEPIAAEVDIAAGSIHLIAGDQTNTVVTVNPANPSSKMDVEAAEKARVELSGSGLSVVVPKPGGIMSYISFRDWGLVDVVIELPAGSSVDAKTGAGDLRADGQFGEVGARSGAGDIHVDQAHARRLVSGAGRLTLGSSLGDTELITAGDMDIGLVEGSAQVKNLNGRTRIGKVSGRLRVRSANGDISVGQAASDVAIRTANGSIEIGELVSGEVSLATASGALDIGIARGTSAWVDARTQFGHVRNDLEPTAGPEDTGAKVEIRARTSFGDVHIHRASSS